MEPSDNIKNIFQRYVDLKNRWELIKEKTHHIIECQGEYNYTDIEWENLDKERFALYKEQNVITETMILLEDELTSGGWKYYLGKLIPFEKSENK